MLLMNSQIQAIRIKIACRGHRQVPQSTKGNIGMFIYNLFFEPKTLERPP